MTPRPLRSFAIGLSLLVALAPPLATAQDTTPNLQDLERRLEAAKREEAARVDAERRAAQQKAADAARKGTLVLRSDAPCTVRIDGKELATLEAGTPQSVAVAPGQQLLACTSTEQPGAKQEQVITAQAGTKTVHQITIAGAVQRLDEQAKAKAAEEAKLQALCANPSSNPVCMEDAGGGILRQPATGLEWTQADNGSDIDWNAATAYCTGKGTGWRLPDMDELSALIYDSRGAHQERCESPTCRLSPLFHRTGGKLWSGNKNDSDQAWFVDLGNDKRYAYHVSYSVNFRALCVRRS